ncbi:MAG: putative rane protein [Blastocatellia bacterium]|jgi:putative membrane protein|nr:putative rane protein [Blastocatellia bacterium]
MRRSQFDQSACDRLAECVKEIERGTDAEIVIVVRARSGSYRHADYLCGAILSFAGLLFLLFSPFDFGHYFVAIDVALLFALGCYLSSRSSGLRRLLTTSKHRQEAVRTGAAAMFYEAGIANTDAEMGVIIYLSLLERRLEIIADRGVLKAAPPLEWNECVYELHRSGRRPQLETLLQGLRTLGALLARVLPPTGENPNELPDMPRFDLK